MGATKAVASSGGVGIGFGGLLTIVLIVLQLCGVINWSWWWVLAPLWLPIATLIVFSIILVVVVILVALLLK